MLNDILKFIVTGLPHSGTTMISDIFRNVPGLYSEFECGFLLHQKPIEFLAPDSRYYNIYYENVKNNWRLTDDDVRYVVNVDNWETVYSNLRQRCPNITDKDIQLFDKTPHYIFYLDDVIGNVKNVPIVVMVKDVRLQYWSLKRRKVNDINHYINLLTDEFAEMLIRYNKSGRIYLARYEDLCLDQENEIRKIFNYLNIEFHSGYLKFKSGYQPQYGDGIQQKYVSAYIDKLSDKEISFLKATVTHPLFYYELNEEDIIHVNEQDEDAYNNTSSLILSKLKHRQDGYRLLSGKGLEIGAFDQAYQPEGCHIEYCDILSREEAVRRFPEIRFDDLVEVKHLCDLNHSGLVMFKDNQFDFGIMNHVLEHLANPIKAVNEIFRIIKPNGFVMLSTFDKNYTSIKNYPSVDIKVLIQKYNDNINEISDDQYKYFIKRLHPDIFAKKNHALNDAVNNARKRREHIYFWDSWAFRTFLLHSFQLLNINASCIFDSTGDQNKFEYFSVWQKL